MPVTKKMERLTNKNDDMWTLIRSCCCNFEIPNLRGIWFESSVSDTTLSDTARLSNDGIEILTIRTKGTYKMRTMAYLVIIICFYLVTLTMSYSAFNKRIVCFNKRGTQISNRRQTAIGLDLFGFGPSEILVVVIAGAVLFGFVIYSCNCACIIKCINIHPS